MSERTAIIRQAISWLGKKESDNSHREIIDAYNSNPDGKPAGYTLQYTDAWCAGFVSACAVKTGLQKKVFCECSCNRMIELYKKAGRWKEDDSYTPATGDIIFYNWNDTGVGDCSTGADHVGIVEKVASGVVTVIEGNKSDAVGRRTIAVNGKYIRGYGLPDYDTTTAETETEDATPTIKALPTVKYGSKGEMVTVVQYLLNYRYGASLVVDGVFGSLTRQAVKDWQKTRDIEIDGVVGVNTWKTLTEV